MTGSASRVGTRPLGRGRRLLFTVLAAGIALVGIVVAAELYFGWVASRERPWELAAYQVGHEDPDDGPALSHLPAVGYVYTRANRHFEEGRINSWGYPDVEFDRESDAFRIVLVGDSVAFGTGVASLDDLYAARAEQALNDRALPGQRFEILNLAIEGYSMIQVYGTLRRVALPLFEPDLVLYAFTSNDFVDTSIEDFQYGQRYEWECLERDIIAPESRPAPELSNDVRFWLKGSSAAYAFARRRATLFRYEAILPSLDAYAEEQAGTARGERLEAFRDRHPYFRSTTRSCVDYDLSHVALEGIVDLVASHGVPFVMMATPVFEFIDEPGTHSGVPFFEWFFRSQPRFPIYRPLDDIRAGLAERGVASDAICVSELDCHPNEWGHSVIADGLAAFLGAQPAIAERLRP